MDKLNDAKFWQEQQIAREALIKTFEKDARRANWDLFLMDMRDDTPQDQEHTHLVWELMNKALTIRDLLEIARNTKDEDLKAAVANSLGNMAFILHGTAADLEAYARDLDKDVIIREDY